MDANTSQGLNADSVFTIVNPSAAHGHAARRWARYEARRHPGAVAFTTPCLGAGDLARQAIADGFRTVLVCGGDGTVNEAVSAILEAPRQRRPALGVLPAGTANDFARAVGNTAWERVVSAVGRGGTRPVDVGIASGSFGRRCFTVAAFLGTPAEVAGRANRRGKRLPGLAGYLLHLGAALRFSADVTVSSDDFSASGPVRAVVVANTPNGGGLRVCPGAAIDDSLLDVLIVEKHPDVGPLQLIWGIARGRHLALPGVQHIQARCVSLTGMDVDLALDGEIVGKLPVRIEVEPGALRVVAP